MPVSQEQDGQQSKEISLQGNVSSTLIFFVNGQKIVDDNVDPEWTLLTYLRLKLRLCGTKLGCGEGGCGACTVMVSKYNRRQKKIEHLSINACLAPICSMHGLAVTTVEGIGSTKTKLHAVQERIAKFHGSQCGFCTPGIVMSMYTLLRNVAKPSTEDLDVYFQGNLCRCTGYRPIIEGFRTFNEHWAAGAVDGGNGTQNGSNGQENGFNGSVNGSNGVQGCCKGEVNGKCCMQNGDDDEDMSEGILSGGLQPYHPDTEPIFPPELQLKTDLDDESLIFKGKHMCWYRPTCLEDFLAIKQENPHAKIVVGNTELGIEMKFKNFQYPVMIQPTYVPELVNITESESGIKFGASVTLSEVEDICMKQAAAQPSWKVQVFTEIADILKYFGGKQIRNVAAVGGNIMTGSPISDLNPIFMSAGCELEVLGVSGTKVIKMDDKFFTGYRRNVIKPDEILLSIKVPYLGENDHFVAYKQARRRDDDIAIVNSAFRMRLNGNVIEDIAMSFGGMSATTVMAKKTMTSMIGKTWDQAMIDDAVSTLITDLPLDASAPGAMVRYRQSLALSFLFKFYLQISNKLNSDNCPVTKEQVSATKPLVKEVVKSHQLYSIEKDGKDKIAVGRPIAHASGELHATGEAVYCDDIPKLENELYLGLVMSSKAHAKLTKIDATKALQMDGVFGFVCHRDLSKERNTFGTTHYIDEELFASEEVEYVGQIIGVTVATDQAIAKKAAKQVVVEYEDLPPIISMEEAIAAKSFFTFDPKISSGDTAKALTSSDHMIEGEMRTGAQEHFYLETQAVIAIPKGEHGEMEIIASTQNPTKTQMVVAHVLGVPANRIVCKVKRMGGGFGGKETRNVPLCGVAAVAANKVRRPVRIMLDRDEDIMISGWRHPFSAKYKVGFNNDGLVQALDVQLYNSAGWSMDLSFGVLERGLFHATNGYYVPNVVTKGRCLKTNLPSNTAFRGFGGPQGMMIAENWITDIAIILDKDPSVIREKNLFREGNMTHYTQVVENDALERCWKECLAQSKYLEVKEELKKFNEENKWKKKGIAIIPTMFGISFTAPYLNQAGAFINIYSDGSVLLSHGGTEMGQGLHTKMLQIASETLKIDISKVHIMESSTDKVPNTPPTAASASSDLNGMAVYNACCVINKRLEGYRKDGCSWEAAVNAAFFDRVSLSTTGFYATPNIGYDMEKNEGRPFAYYTNGAACSVVEIDCLTGDHQVLKTDIVMDVGQSINPAIDIGQIEGAFTQGYGMFVMEQMVHSPSGVPYTRGPGAYKIPSFNDIPAEFNVTLLKDSSNPHAVYSSKGIGEPPLFLAASVFFAIKDAIIAARKERGLSPLFKMDAPATAERIRMACEDEFTARVPLIDGEKSKPWGIQV